MFKVPQKMAKVLLKKKSKCRASKKFSKFYKVWKCLKKIFKIPQRGYHFKGKNIFKVPALKKKGKKILSSWTSLRHPH